jgi:hypothetical protein
MSESLDAHVARVLLLVDTFSSPSGIGLDGLTKLAKLDFLLRYPVFLESLNARQGVTDPAWEPPREVERQAVESPMMRYKYGPWDDRYYVVVGGLIGRGLAEYIAGRGNVALRVTDEGHRIATTLSQLHAWSDVAARLQCLRRNYDMSGSRLKELIYESFPRLIAQPIGSNIEALPLEVDRD